MSYADITKAEYSDMQREVASFRAKVADGRRFFASIESLSVLDRLLAGAYEYSQRLRTELEFVDYDEERRARLGLD